MKKIIFIFIFQYLLFVSSFAQVWHSVGGGLGAGIISSFKVYGNNLYVGGGIVCAGGLDTIICPNCITARGIVKWDGQQWSNPFTSDSNFNGNVMSIEIFNNKFYVGGDIINIEGLGLLARNFAMWDSIEWKRVGSSGTPNGFVQALRYKGNLFLAGSFNYIGSVGYSEIAEWNDSSFSNLGDGLFGGMDGTYALIEYNGKLIAGGGFTNAGDTLAFGVAAWDGQKWYPLDTGLLGTVYTLTVDTVNNFLYAGGTIDYAGGNDDMTRIYNIARWDGYEWLPVGSDSGSIFYNGILSLKFYHNYLFVSGGETTGTNGDTVLAKWDGSKWNKIEGPYHTLTCLEVYNDELYIGGYFNEIGDSTMYNIARYYEPPDTSCDYLQAIIQPKNATLNISDSTTVHFYNNIILGSSWHWDFGDGVTDSVRMPVHIYTDSGVFNVSVIVTYQNCTDTAYATVTIVDDTGIKNNKNDSTEYLGNNIPNPFDNSTTIPYYVPYGSKGFLQITDTKGELLDEYALQQGKNKLEISLEYLKAGAYFYSIVIDGKVMQTKKMIFE